MERLVSFYRFASSAHQRRDCGDRPGETQDDRLLYRLGPRGFLARFLAAISTHTRSLSRGVGSSARLRAVLVRLLALGWPLRSPSRACLDRSVLAGPLGENSVGAPSHGAAHGRSEASSF